MAVETKRVVAKTKASRKNAGRAAGDRDRSVDAEDADGADDADGAEGAIAAADADDIPDADDSDDAGKGVEGSAAARVAAWTRAAWPASVGSLAVERDCGGAAESRAFNGKATTRCSAAQP